MRRTQEKFLFQLTQRASRQICTRAFGAGESNNSTSLHRRSLLKMTCPSRNVHVICDREDYVVKHQEMLENKEEQLNQLK